MCVYILIESHKSIASLHQDQMHRGVSMLFCYLFLKLIHLLHFFFFFLVDYSDGLSCKISVSFIWEILFTILYLKWNPQRCTQIYIYKGIIIIDGVIIHISMIEVRKMECYIFKDYGISVWVVYLKPRLQ